MTSRRSSWFAAVPAVLVLVLAGCVEESGRVSAGPVRTTTSDTLRPAPASAPAFPDETTTGPAAAGFTNLVPYSGPTVITQPGAVIEGRMISAPIEIAADNVTIRGNSIRTASSIQYDVPVIGLRPGTKGARVVDNEITGRDRSADASPASGVKLYGDDIEFRRNNVSGIAGDAVTMDGNNIEVTDNYVHDFVFRPGTHYDAVVYGGSNTTNRVRIAGNRIEMWLPEDMTALVSLPDSSPSMVVDANLLAGGGYAVSGGGGGATFTDNRFSTKFSPKCGSWGTHAHLAKPGHEEITWSGNTWADGPSADKLVPL